MKKTMDMLRETNYYMRYSEGLAMPGSLLWHQRKITREQVPIRALVSFKLQRNMCASMRKSRLLGNSLRLACSD